MNWLRQLLGEEEEAPVTTTRKRLEQLDPGLKAQLDQARLMAQEYSSALNEDGYNKQEGMGVLGGIGATMDVLGNAFSVRDGGKDRTGNLLSDQYIERAGGAKAKANASQEAMFSGLFQDAGLSYIKSKREEKEQALKQIAIAEALGRPVNPRLYEKAGLPAPSDPTGASSQAAPAQPQAAPAQEPPTMPSFGGKIGPQARPGMGGPVAGGQGSPAIAGGASPPPEAPKMYQRSPTVEKMYEQAFSVGQIDEKEGANLFRQAQQREEHEMKLFENEQKALTDAKTGVGWSNSNTALYELLDAQGNPTGTTRPAQFNSAGQIRMSQQLDPRTGQPMPEDPNFDPKKWRFVDKATMAGNVASAKIRAEASGQIPQAMHVAKTMTDDLNALLNDEEGLKTSVGVVDNTFGLVPRSVLPDASAAARRYSSRLEKAKGDAFLVAFQSLKGAGAITEMEGSKAQAAITRLQSTNMDPADYKIAVQDAIKYIEETKQLALRKAQAQQMAPDAAEYGEGNEKVYRSQKTGLWYQNKAERDKDDGVVTSDRTSAPASDRMSQRRQKFGLE